MAKEMAEARQWYSTALEIAERISAEDKDSLSVSFQLNILRPLLECHRSLGEQPEADACQTRIETLQAGQPKAKQPGSG